MRQKTHGTMVPVAFSASPSRLRPSSRARTSADILMTRPLPFFVVPGEPHLTGSEVDVVPLQR